MNIVQNIENIKKQLSDNNINLKIIAVSKTFELFQIQPLIDHGHLIFGENKVQETKFKWAKLLERNNDLEIHLIGGLQTNKAKDAVQLFKFIHSVDRKKLVDALKIAEERLNFKRKYFLQVNTGQELQKFGVAPEEVENLFKYAKGKLNIIGLMCIPPKNEDSKVHFKILSNLAKKLKLSELSMGMSHDFVEAGLSGATYVRIGSKIFGERS